MKYENLLASRYIKAQKRQSAFTVISIIAAVAIITMVFLLYSVFMDCLRNTEYSKAPYHLMISDLTEKQGEALANEDAVRSVKLLPASDGKVAAMILFDRDIGDSFQWLSDTAAKHGFENIVPDKKYAWNENLMNIDTIGYDAHLYRLRIFCMFFIFAVFMAFALRLVIDTSFEVSSKERERHYGVLQSIGATPEQIVRIITYEGLKLCIISVPIGLLAGIVLAYVMFNVILTAGLSELFHGMTNTKIYLPFSVDPKMLLVAAAVGVVWVFLSAYGVGMRIIRKMPMEAITTRTDEVKKVKRHTLSGILFGVSGSIASRNARRQKKRFAITVLTLTVSITLFALFSTITETVERSIKVYMEDSVDISSKGVDFSAEIGSIYTGTTYEEAAELLADSGMFRDIRIEVTSQSSLADVKGNFGVAYLNRESYTAMFGDDPAVSYDELVSTGGYVFNQGSKDGAEVSKAIKQNDKLQLNIFRRTIPEGINIYEMDKAKIIKQCEYEKHLHEIRVIGTVSANKSEEWNVLLGALETYQAVEDEWYGDNIFGANAAFSYIKENDYNATDHKKAMDWFREHSDTVIVDSDIYKTKLELHNVMASVMAGVLILNLLIALAALINLINIISTGIANRRSEMASMQCVGMTDRQLYRMTLIESMQFAGAAAVISAIICAVIIFGSKLLFSVLINNTFVNETEEERQMIKDMIEPDRVTPFIRIILAAAAAFAAGAVTSFVMLRAQNKDTLSDQIRGSEMKLDTKKSHILRNSIIAVVSAFVLMVGGMRIYSVISYHNDRKEYEKAGYLNLVDSNGFKMNVYSTGAKHGKHTIIGLAGMGCNAFPVETTKLNELLGKENTLVYPDRAGYGFSGDSMKTQTVEQAVEDYRTGLKNAGFEAPYVLMGHSYGDLYALYWEMKYPDEVEAIIVLDGSIPPKNEMWQTYTAEGRFPSEDAARKALNRLVMRTWLGLDKLFPDTSESEGTTEGASILTDEQLRISELCGNRFFTAAFSSEILLEKQEVTHMGEILSTTDTPKLWFSTYYTCEDDIRQSYERMKADYKAEGKELKLNPEKAASADWRNHRQEIEDTLTVVRNFTEKLGNCRLEFVVGDHGIFYAQKPEQIANSILELLAET